MKVIIDEELCTGHGRCYAMAPEIFEPDDQGRGQVISAEQPAELRDRAMIAVQNCPEGAISVED